MKNSLCVVALVLVGCAAGEPGVEIVAAQLGSDDCELLNCPGNSNLMGVLAPYELHETGAEFSSRQLRISGMWRYGQPVTAIEVLGASLRATTGLGTLQGGGLIGLRMRLEHESGQMFELRIDSYLTAKVPYYNYVGAPSEIEGFHIVYRVVGERREQELCPYATHDDAGVNGTWAVFWKGDRYDPETGHIFASDDQVGPWFNISCAGEATIKMLRTKTGGAVAPASPVERRQATLNMFTASYCGPTGPLVTTNNQPFTMLGQPLVWNDLYAPNQLGAVESYEAVWDESGAVCLTTPRHVPLADIDCGHEIPSCGETAASEQIANWDSYGWLLSANPFP